MKTTIEINDDLLVDARSYAAEHMTSLRRVLEDALILLVHGQGRAVTGGIELRKHPFHGKGLQPPARDMTWAEIRALAYEGPWRHGRP